MRNFFWPVIFLCVALVGAVFLAAPVLAFEWPGSAGMAQIFQAIKQEIANGKSLLASAQSKKPITAAAYIAIDLTNNKALLEKNPNKAYPIASVTKLMNAVVVLDNTDTDKSITLAKKMLAFEGSSPSIYEGLNISLKDLLQASLTQSVNDAAESLAISFGRDKFLVLMNKKAASLGMTKTAYYDATGLNPKNQSTAADLAKLLKYIYENHKEILASTKDNNFWLPDKNGTLLKFRNMNGFYNDDQFIGGKTGYLDEAGQTFAAVFKIKDKPTAIVIMHSKNYQADTFRIIDQLEK